LSSVAAAARRGGAVSLALACLCAASPAEAQNLDQDAKDLRGFTTFVLGSGARAFGMGGAFLARADDATAASWNPAGLSYLRRPEFSMVGVRSSMDRTERRRGELEEERGSGNAPDLIAFAYPFTFSSASGSAQVSFQRAASFSVHRTIENPDTLRIVDSSGGFDVLAFGTGVRLSRKIRVGATLNRWLHGYEQTLERQGGRPSFQSNDFRLSGWNLNLGAIWSPFESLNVGVVGKTAFTGRLRIERERTDTFIREGITTQNAFSSDAVRLDFPGAIGFGASWRPLSRLTISSDYTRTFWSSGAVRNFFTLPATPSTAVRPPPDFFTSLPYPTLDDPNQQDTVQVRLGVEYVFIRERFKWPVRAGYVNDRQIFTGLDGEAPRFNGVTVGAGVVFGPLLFDVAFLYESGEFIERNESQTSVKARKLLASVIYRHGTGR
jgi:hypothetical protein